MITKKSLQNLNALMFLSALAEYKSKRKASEMMNTSMDTVNKYISNLEYSLGVQLVVNDTRGCRLTEKGTEIVAKLGNIEDVLTYVQKQSSDIETYKGDVSICVPLTISMNFPNCYKSDFFEKYPDIKIVSTTTIDTPEYEKMGVDLAVVMDIPKESNKYSLIYKKEIEYGLFASKKYIEKYGLPKDIDDLLENHRLICKTTNYHPISTWRDIVSKAKNACFYSNSYFSVNNVINNGVGIGIMPVRGNIENFVHLDKLKLNASADFYLMANNATKDVPRVSVVANHFKKVLGDNLR